MTYNEIIPISSNNIMQNLIRIKQHLSYITLPVFTVKSSAVRSTEDDNESSNVSDS
jgi:hypothetical protein